ncbi:hypothetical protein AKJ16_DCAP02670 [Drosera capensis]
MLVIRWLVLDESSSHRESAHRESVRAKGRKLESEVSRYVLWPNRVEKTRASVSALVGNQPKEDVEMEEKADETMT